jgi:nifR3 family TIM-barrel protein
MGTLRLGEVTLKNGLLLAPMAGVSDAALRALCRRMGADMTVSEMVSAKALCYEQKSRPSAPLRTAPLATVTEEDAPMAVQLFGSDPDFMREAAVLIANGTYRGATGTRPVAIDINMGCPVHKVVANGEGSALMKTPDRAAAIVAAVRGAVSLPVTVKIRAGWDNQSRNAVEFAKQMEAAGADLICVHGRTRQQMYAPGSDNGIIAAVKAAVSVPVVGNGDLFTSADVLHMLKETGCDGVMIARGALGNPFLFAECAALLEGRPYVAPTAEERLAVALEHARDLMRRKGERIGAAEARKHMAWYSKGLRGSATARDTLMHANSIEEIKAVFDRLLEEERQ